MKMKYCPECGSIQIENRFEEEQKCKKCRYVGKMNEDSVDVINSLVKAKKFGTTITTVQSTPATSLIMKQQEKPSSLKDRIKKFDDDVELL